MYAARQIVVLYNGLSKEQIALLRTIAVKAFLGSHLVNGLVHGLDDGRTQRTGYVAYAEANHVCFLMRHLEGIYLLCDVCKQIILRQF